MGLEILGLQALPGKRTSAKQNASLFGFTFLDNPSISSYCQAGFIKLHVVVFIKEGMLLK